MKQIGVRRVRLEQPNRAPRDGNKTRSVASVLDDLQGRHSRALRRLADRTIVWTHVQFAVTVFASALMAVDLGGARRRSLASG